MSYIGVVDCNNFFVSCERLFRPDLHNKPVLVLSSNDGCVVARSQEVKDIGIAMGVPYFKVKDILKDNDVTMFSSHFALYRDISRRVFEVLQEELDTVEQYSVDEAFFGIGKNENLLEVARRIKDTIEKRVGIPVSVGISDSKTKAKYAVELAKKDTGIKILEKEEWKNISATLALSALWGVGKQSTVKYREAGYETVGDLLQADSSRIAKLFGVVGTRLLAELNGEVAYPLGQHHEEQKSIMSSRSFKENTENISVLADAVAYHARHIGSELRKKKLSASLVRVSIQPSRHGDFVLQGSTSAEFFDTPTNDTLCLVKVVNKLLNNSFKPNVPYKKVGVSVSGLVPETQVQPNLFTDESSNKNNVLMRVIDTVNKSGKEILTIGDFHYGDKWKSRKDMVSPAYTTKWTDVVKVSA